MSMLALMDRRVHLLRTTVVTVKDQYGDETTTTDRLGPFPARRSLKAVAEETSARNSQTRWFRYFLDPDATWITGHDEIEDDGERLEIVGEVDYVPGAIGVHHIEFDARIVKG